MARRMMMRAMLILLSLMLVFPAFAQPKQPKLDVAPPAFAQHGRPGGGDHRGPGGDHRGPGWDHGGHGPGWDRGDHGFGWDRGPGWEYGGFYWRCRNDWAFHALHLGECGF